MSYYQNSEQNRAIKTANKSSEKSVKVSIYEDYTNRP
jgi:hypothetical protein